MAKAPSKKTPKASNRPCTVKGVKGRIWPQREMLSLPKHRSDPLPVNVVRPMRLEKIRERQPH